MTIEELTYAIKETVIRPFSLRNPMFDRKDYDMMLPHILIPRVMMGAQTIIHAWLRQGQQIYPLSKDVP